MRYHLIYKCTLILFMGTVFKNLNLILKRGFSGALKTLSLRAVGRNSGTPRIAAFISTLYLIMRIAD